jgi:hypothetical protein
MILIFKLRAPERAGSRRGAKPHPLGSFPISQGGGLPRYDGIIVKGPSPAPALTARNPGKIPTDFVDCLFRDWFARSRRYRCEDLQIPRQIIKFLGSPLDSVLGFLRWYDKTRIFEVDGVFLTAPHTAP